MLVLMAPVAGAIAHAAPSSLDRAKQVYGEGKVALDAKDYATATSKFEEAYRLARDKHVFNYNIASAAELAGDCRKAEQHYSMFLDLVPEHDARKAATESLAKLKTTCVHDDEGAAALTIEARGERESARASAVGDRALLEALRATDQSIARYDAVLERYGRQQPFAQIVRAKRRASKKLTKLIESREVARPAPEKTDLSAPNTVEQACRQAETQEERNIAAYTKVFDLFEDADVVDLMDKLTRRAEGRHLRAFRDTCPR